MLQHSRRDAVQLWLVGGPWEVERGTGSCDGVTLQSVPVSHVLVTRETRPTDCCVLSSQTRHTLWL